MYWYKQFGIYLFWSIYCNKIQKMYKILRTRPCFSCREKDTIINNNSLKWRWIVVDIYWAAKNIHHFHQHWGEYFFFVLYHTSWITSRPKSNFICYNMPPQAILFVFSCSEVNSTWLITAELPNQRARKVLFTWVVKTNVI